MKIDGLGSIVEIMPFYGTLDRVYLFMKTLNKKTNKLWDNGMPTLNKIIKKRRIVSSEKQTLETYLKKFIAKHMWYQLFAIETIEIDSESSLSTLSNFIKYHKEKDWLKFSKIEFWNHSKRDNHYWEWQYNPLISETIDSKVYCKFIQKLHQLDQGLDILESYF